VVFRKMKTLVCNSGSSSLKFSLFEADQELLLADGSLDWATKRWMLVASAASAVASFLPNNC